MLTRWRDRSVLMDLAQRVADALSTRGLTLATAESCTGGMLSGLLTELAGASAFFVGGVIAYHNDVKTVWLGVPESLLMEHGAVSRATSLAMAERCREGFGVDCAISITGIAGPGGGTVEKPVGLVFVAFAGLGTSMAREHRFCGTREDIRGQSVMSAMTLILEVARGESGETPPESS